MRRCIDRAAHPRWAVWLGALVFVGSWLGLACIGSGAIVRVEEDWEMVVDQPDVNTDSPQITTVFAPLGQLNPLYGAFTLNHRPEPAYIAGGLQLQLWIGEEMIFQTQSAKTGVMSTAGETVTWTNVMAAGGGQLTLEVVNGASQTWGSFGGLGNLKLILPQIVDTLDLYDPSVTVQRSAVVFGGNRVRSLKILRVRLFSDDGQVFEDAEPRTVHALLE